jgi:hypothetical protein
MTDDELRDWLKAALPPVAAGPTPADAWRRVNERLDEPPPWSLVDATLALAVAIALAIFPEWGWVIAHYL